METLEACVRCRHDAGICWFSSFLSVRLTWPLHLGTQIFQLKVTREKGLHRKDLGSACGWLEGTGIWVPISRGSSVPAPAAFPSHHTMDQFIQVSALPCVTPRISTQGVSPWKVSGFRFWAVFLNNISALWECRHGKSDGISSSVGSRGWSHPVGCSAKGAGEGSTSQLFFH